MPRAFMTVIHQLETVTRIINDTLFIARLEVLSACATLTVCMQAGALELEIAPMTMRSVVDKTMRGFQPVAVQKGLKVSPQTRERCR